ncbi:MAG: PfkB family carbohydrate kinase [Paracoccaceae bacterium]
MPVVSAVGAGDSFVAGLVLARARGEDWPQALALGTAAAAAAVMTPATELCRAEDVNRLLPKVTLSPV